MSSKNVESHFSFENGIIDSYLPGSDITILNTLYFRPKKIQESSGKISYTEDCMAIVYRNNTTGKKGVQYIEEPPYEYYMVMDAQYKKSYPRAFIQKDQVVPVQTKYTSLEKDIANRTHNRDFYDANIRNNDRGNNKKLHKSPDVFNSDMSIDDFYRKKFNELYTNEPFTPTKAFFDIEVDGKYQAGDFPEPGEN